MMKTFGGMFLLLSIPLFATSIMACTREVVKEVPVEIVVEKEVVKEVSIEIVVEKEVIKEVEVPVEVTKEVVVFRRPISAFEHYRIDVTKTNEGCYADPNHINVMNGQRLRLSLELHPTVYSTATETGSSTSETERDKVRYRIDGLTVCSSCDEHNMSVTHVDVELESGALQSYDFNVLGGGIFDVLCDGEEIGSFIVETDPVIHPIGKKN